MHWRVAVDNPTCQDVAAGAPRLVRLQLDPTEAILPAGAALERSLYQAGYGQGFQVGFRLRWISLLEPHGATWPLMS